MRVNVAGTVTFGSVAIVLTDGRKVAISELGLADEMKEEIMRGGGAAKVFFLGS